MVVIVAHGPVADEENNRWLADMRVLADAVRGKSKFKRIEYLTVRDDAPEPIRSKATAELRSVVQRGIDENSNVLIVPLLAFLRRDRRRDQKTTRRPQLHDEQPSSSAG